ncbi:MAG: zinc metalloprotease HtpX [Nanoarchaeota archaeon]
MLNQLKTFILLAVLTGLVLWIGSLFGTTGLVMAIVLVVVMNSISFFFSDKIVLAIYRAKPADKKEYAKLHAIVEDVARKAGIPKPKIFIIPSEAANAFATGKGPGSGVVACTRGILSMLNEEELRGVIAHEMSHIKNRDTLIQTVAAMLAGIISYLASMAQWAAIFGGSRDDNGSQNIISLLVLAIVAPIAAIILQLAISRSREYLADETAAKTLHNGKGLASALKKLEAEVNKNPLRFGTRSTSSLFITNPFRGGAFWSLFSTHPPMPERISRLEKMRW